MEELNQKNKQDNQNSQDNNITIIRKQCEKASKYSNEVIEKLLNKNNNDIVEVIFIIEDDKVNEEINKVKKIINWEEELEKNKFDHKIIRKILNEREKFISAKFT